MRIRAGWTLVETMTAGEVTVVARDNDPRGRTSFRRSVQDRIGAGQAPGAEAAQWLAGIVEGLRTDIRPVQSTHILRNGLEVGARAVPVLGPDGDLFGVHMWLGPARLSPTGPPLPAFGFVWDASTRIADIPPALAGMPRAKLTAPEMFRFIEPADGLSLITALLTPQPGASWEGAMTVIVDQRRVPAHAVLVAGPADGQWRGLLFEVTGAENASGRSLEAAALEAIPRMTNVHMALVDVQKMRLLRWITDPMTDVIWKGEQDQRDAPHPEDVERIFANAAEIFSGTVDSASVDKIRLRRRGGGWVVVNGAAAILRTTEPPLAIVQFHVVGYSDDPDPVPPTDTGHPGLPPPEERALGGC
ncbi:GAF domain-containing protein [Nocardia brasiliensis]|uniref:GAF domain-containing protein n=1 Tax=Nocardia brasiliensis TaxID=37326 RepID=UPI0024588F35|nr:GAF domain-containing protein [Nocardia brasiliensis]